MSGFLKVFGLDKVAKLPQIIKQHGGLKASLYHLYRTDDLKVRLSLSRRILKFLISDRKTCRRRQIWKQILSEWWVFLRPQPLDYLQCQARSGLRRLYGTCWVVRLAALQDRQDSCGEGPCQLCLDARTPGQHFWILSRLMTLRVFWFNMTRLTRVISGADTLMGSNNAYMPYSTTKPKIQSWVPPKN